MNGIYNFEGYRTPYLDVEMLMERKAKRQERRVLVLACVAAVIMAAAAVVTLAATAFVDTKIFMILVTIFALYLVVGAIAVGKFMKKRETEVWQPLV